MPAHRKRSNAQIQSRNARLANEAARIASLTPQQFAAEQRAKWVSQQQELVREAKATNCCCEMNRDKRGRADAVYVQFERDGTIMISDDYECKSDRDGARLLKSLVGEALQCHLNVISQRLANLVLHETMTERNLRCALNWDTTTRRDTDVLLPSVIYTTKAESPAALDDELGPHKERMTENSQETSSYCAYDQYMKRAERQILDRVFGEQANDILRNRKTGIGINMHSVFCLNRHRDLVSNKGWGAHIITAVLRSRQPSIIVLERHGNIGGRAGMNWPVWCFAVPAYAAWTLLDGHAGKGTPADVLRHHMTHAVHVSTADSIVHCKGVDRMCRGQLCHCRVAANLRVGGAWIKPPRVKQEQQIKQESI